MSKPITYKESGVNIDAGNAFVEAIKPMIKSTQRREVLTGIGGFAGLFSINKLKYDEPVLVASTDGVGTKLKLALDYGKCSDLGQDLVAMCVNDVLCTGAEPLFFLDYYATGKLRPERAVELIKSMTQCLKDINCALIGGETAEMPGVYQENDFDLAGFAVGVVNRKDIIDGSNISIGNAVIGIASSGVHSNGFSLVRKIIEQKKLELHRTYPGFHQTLGQVLLEPTKIYVNQVLHIRHQYKVLGLSHITGGGLIENIPRCIPDSCKVIIKKASWPTLPIFQFLQTQGNVTDDEMIRVFNCGIGMVMVCLESEAQDIVSMLNASGEKAYLIGHIEARKENEEQFEIV